MTIKGIIFDLGGVLIDVDYQKTIEAFQVLGATNAQAIYTQTRQKEYVDNFERGVIARNTFIELLRSDLQGLRLDVTDCQIENAWNAMLIGFQRHRLEIVRKFKAQGYKVFLFPNIDAIHYDGVIEHCKKNGLLKEFTTIFDKQYFSHKVGYNKPWKQSFILLAQDIQKHYNLSPSELLFIDDSEKHIFGSKYYLGEGALAAGLNGVHVKSNLTNSEFELILQKNCSV